MLQPASFGGYGRQTGIYGGLEGVEFAARCPPDVQKDTRIVAVCGIPDSKAAPQEDGWFFSDFFLFYQMLSSRRAVAELPNQLWLSSCSPSDLIRRHERYLHGPANGIAGDRRVVMNAKMLPGNEMQAGFRVFKPKDLLERFLGTLKFEIKEAARTKQPVLVLIFGHGEQKAGGIFIGCDDGSLKLTPERLASVLKKEVQTTMILTSCYSGGWIMNPNLNEHFDVKPRFNHTFLTAAGSESESISWSLSQTVGRQAGGSVFATCLLNSIITASDRTGDDKGEDISLSMAALTQQIVYECEARCGSLWEEHQFSFAAQDDLWAKAWRKRTGLPLLNYKEKWESLPEAPLMKKIYPPTGPLTGSIMSKSPGALYNIVKVKATRYMNSNPGLDNSGCNTNCHPGFHKLVEGTPLEFDKLYRLNDILDYRQGQIGLAEIYCYTLEIGVPEDRQVDEFDESKWYRSQLLAKNGSSTERSKVAIDLLKRFHTIKGWVIHLYIFDSPLPGQGYDYSKPTAYLAARLAESPMPTHQIHKKLEDLSQYRLEEARRAARSPLGVAVLNQPEIKTMRGRLYKTVGKLRHRLRSLSPQKRLPGMEGGSYEG
ncbi:hypothetical protein OIDMADRAFT_150218 [Oidiodendron maius Zn]|uniref:Uncharacterized protein n=1 Tax=Oidiodendron maius (strain Zn) TaxID=913774 RepID=A0A0C3HXM4_OIDMZ|nr:hypothetical protein OIDMADRAFT_150218 [Oidiodendron maius Zn]